MIGDYNIWRKAKLTAEEQEGKLDPVGILVEYLGLQ